MYTPRRRQRNRAQKQLKRIQDNHRKIYIIKRPKPLSCTPKAAYAPYQAQENMAPRSKYLSLSLITSQHKKLIYLLP